MRGSSYVLLSTEADCDITEPSAEEKSPGLAPSPGQQLREGLEDIDGDMFHQRDQVPHR